LSQYYLRIRGRVQGPFALEQLQQMAARGQVSRIHEISTDQQHWNNANLLPEIFTSGLPSRQSPESGPPTSVGAQDALTVAPADTVDWYYAVNKQRQGPVKQAELLELLASQQLPAQTLVWHAGLTSWMAATNVPELHAPSKPAPDQAASAPSGALLQPGAGVLQKSFEGLEQPAYLGRDPRCQYHLQEPMAALHHARLTRRQNGYILEDLGSIIGTQVNGRRIYSATPLQLGDIVTIGRVSIKFGEPAKPQAARFEVKNFQDQIKIRVRSLGVEVPGKQLLQNVSLTIEPGEFVGLMGPSGAGKTTLMYCLNGYTVPSRGSVEYSGHDLYKSYDLFRGQIGYVPQDDIMHGDLTVFQALFYTARLRFPPDYSSTEIVARIRRVMQQLGLQGTEQVLIGSPQKKGISGGQRKRVNLAMELITDPLILFLDEPTSGLSSEDALTVMKLLRGLADEGKSILLTIHQPSLEAFRQLDHLLIIAKDLGSTQAGQLAYFGPAYPDSIRFFQAPEEAAQEPHPDQVLRGLGKQAMQHWREKYQHSTWNRQYVLEREQAASPHAGPTQRRRFPNLFGQTLTLVQRALRIKLADTWNTGLLLVQAPIIATLIVIVFGKQVNETPNTENWPSVAKAVSTSMFLITLAAIWFGCSNAAREIVAEWSIYRRERMVNLRISSYVLSKFLVFILFCAIQCAIMLGIVKTGCSLKVNWLYLYGILLLASVLGVAIGLAVSAIARTSEVAVACLPILILPMVILGGVLQPVHKMNVLSQGLSFIVPSRWAFESVLVSEAAKQPKFDPPAVPVMPQQPPPAAADQTAKDTDQSAKDTDQTAQTDQEKAESIDMAEDFFPHKKHRHTAAVPLLMLGSLLSCLIVAILVILRYRDIH
jgi:ABC-type multidrug transport system ATPase subunit